MWVGDGPTLSSVLHSGDSSSRRHGRSGSWNIWPIRVSDHVQQSEVFWFNSGSIVTGRSGILKLILGQSPENCDSPLSSAEPLQGHKEKRHQDDPHR